jgi:hypothetical protein
MKTKPNRDDEPEEYDALLRVGNLIVPSRMEWLRRAAAIQEEHEYGVAEDVSKNA